MKLPPTEFWHWFLGFAKRLPHEGVSDSLQDELLSHLQCFDKRLYFLLSTNSPPKELIFTADGNEAAFEAADTLVMAAPKIPGWKFIALKPPMGFDFRHTDGKISIDVKKLWFKPSISSANPGELGIIVAFPDADFVLENQSVDTAYTILETAIGERNCTCDIARVSVDDLPNTPETKGYIELYRLPEFIASHKRRCQING